MELSREFIYQMESQDFQEDDALLDIIHSLPTYHGEPLRLCKACQSSVELCQQEQLEEEQHQDLVRQKANQIWLVTVLLAVFSAVYFYV